MSPFTIFAIVLTLAYIIYYGVMISRDLTKTPGQEDSNEENIDVDVFKQDEEPETVKSVGDGFQVGDGPVHQPEPLPNVISLDSEGNVTAEGLDKVLSSDLCQRVGEAIEEMKDIKVDSQPQVTKDDYAKSMVNLHGFSVEVATDEL